MAIKEEKPITLAQVQSMVGDGERSQEVKEFLKNFKMLTLKKAEDLKIQFNDLNTVSWGEVPDFDMIINATSLGLNNETIDLNTSNIGGGKFFYDVIYNPNETNFLKLGKKLGNQIENGKLMFIYQAFDAFRLWHGVEPNVSEKILKLLDHD